MKYFRNKLLRISVFYFLSIAIAFPLNACRNNGTVISVNDDADNGSIVVDSLDELEALAMLPSIEFVVRFEKERYMSRRTSGDVGLGIGFVDTYSPYDVECSLDEDYGSGVPEMFASVVESVEDKIDVQTDSFYNENISRLIACGASATPFLIENLKSEDDRARFMAVLILEEMGAVANHIVIPALIEVMLNDEDPSIRVNAAGALSLISSSKDQNVMKALARAKTDPGVLPIYRGNEHDLEVSVRISKIIKEMESPDRKPEFRDARCPVKFAYGAASSQEYRRFYHFDNHTEMCVVEGSDEGTATGGRTIFGALKRRFGGDDR